jgi:hypothetical protein
MEPKAIKEAREFVAGEAEFWEGFKECEGNHGRHFENRVIQAQWVIEDILKWYESIREDNEPQR